MAWIFTKQSKFYLHTGETLLKGLLRVGYPVRYQCGAGYCGACKLKCNDQNLQQAHLRYIRQPLVMLEKDDILPCCCQVFGVLHLKIDEPN